MRAYVCVRQYECVCPRACFVVSVLNNLRSLILCLNKIQALKSTNLVELKLTKIKLC